MKQYIVARRVGKCAVLGVALGWNYDGKEEYAYFAVLGIDAGARPCLVDNAAYFIRLTKWQSDAAAIDRLSNFCVGYDTAIQHKSTGHQYGAIEASTVNVSMVSA